jgi:hypothetical protein
MSASTIILAAATAAAARIVAIIKAHIAGSHTCPECGAGGRSYWFRRVECPACGCRWRWIYGRDGEWSRTSTRHVKVAVARSEQ